MTSGVQGQWMCDLQINGQPVDVDPVNIFKDITIRSHIHMDLPSITLNFKDKGSELLEGVGLCDGMPITCTMDDSSGGGASQAPQFLATGNPQVGPGDGAHDVTQVGSLANPDWNRQIHDKAIKGNSSDVASQLAQMAGLQANVDTTNDTMTWLPNGKSLCSYARFLSEKAWIGENSAIVTGVGEDGTFFFKDLMQLIGGSGSTTFGFDDGQIPYHEFIFASKGAMYNAARGYGSTTHQDDGSGTPLEFNQITAGLMSGFSGIGSVFSTAAGTLGMRYENSPIDSGNVHQNYRQATHNNRRIKGLYSEDVKIKISQYSGVKLYDNVTFNAFDMYTGNPLDNYTGQYLITGIARYIQDNQYWELLTLTTQGPNTDGSGSSGS